MVDLVVLHRLLRASSKKVVNFFRKKCTPRQNPGYAYDRYEPALWDCSMEMMQFCVETYVSVCVTFLRSAKADYRRHTLNAFAKVAFSHPHHHRAPLITPSGCNYFTARNSYNSCSYIAALYSCSSSTFFFSTWISFSKF